MANIKELIEDTFNNNDNYKICCTNAKTNNAIIFFSSHAVYLEENFEELILKKDKYEWLNISKNKLIQKYYKMIIFVRDLKKFAYTKGINSELNTQDKLIKKLKELTEGYRVTVCGNSAGAYMAELTGIKLKAERVFSFSGYYKIAFESPYNDLTQYITGEIPIFYFLPFNCEGDKIQYEIAKDLKGVYPFKSNSNSHGRPFEGKIYPYLLTKDNNYLLKCHERYKDKIVDSINFAYSFMPLNIKVKEYLKIFFRKNNKK